MTLLASNLTNAVAALATRIDLLANGVNEQFQIAQMHLNTAMNGEDRTAREHAKGTVLDAMAKAEHSIVALKSEADQVNNLAKQMPLPHTNPATVGAIGTTDDGTGVVGIAGSTEDIPVVAETGAPTNVVEGTGIVGNSPESVLATEEKPAEAEGGK